MVDPVGWQFERKEIDAIYAGIGVTTERSKYGPDTHYDARSPQPHFQAAAD